MTTTFAAFRNFARGHPTFSPLPCQPIPKVPTPSMHPTWFRHVTATISRRDDTTHLGSGESADCCRREVLVTRQGRTQPRDGSPDAVEMRSAVARSRQGQTLASPNICKLNVCVLPLNVYLRFFCVKWCRTSLNFCFGVLGLRTKFLRLVVLSGQDTRPPDVVSQRAPR